ncbi:MAG: chromate transporter, partial [Bacteroidota bacterium]
IGGVLGYIFFKQENVKQSESPKVNYSFIHVLVTILLVLIVSLNFFPISFDNIHIEISKVFSEVSLTLFGGGYVMIPMLNEILVVQKSWLSNTEFRDAISLGQITPGPILISATFIGYKLKGIGGAIIATIGIFLPSGLLMILVSDLFKRIEENIIWKAVFEGLKSVVIALIISSVLILGRPIVVGTLEEWWLSGIIFVVSFILLLRFKINILWLIGLAGLFGILFL